MSYSRLLHAYKNLRSTLKCCRILLGSDQWQQRSATGEAQQPSVSWDSIGTGDLQQQQHSQQQQPWPQQSQQQGNWQQTSQEQSSQQHTWQQQVHLEFVYLNECRKHATPFRNCTCVMQKSNISQFCTFQGGDSWSRNQQQSTWQPQQPEQTQSSSSAVQQPTDATQEVSSNWQQQRQSNWQQQQQQPRQQWQQDAKASQVKH